MKNLRYFLNDSDSETIATFDTFDKELIKIKIVEHLKANPSDMLTFEKELTTAMKRKYAGNQIIDFYEVNPKTNEVSRVIERGGRNCYISLEE